MYKQLANNLMCKQLRNMNKKIAQVTESSYKRLKTMMEHTEDDVTMLSTEQAFVKTGENIDDVDLHTRSGSSCRMAWVLFVLQSAGCNGME